MDLNYSNFMELDTKLYNVLLDAVKDKHPLLKHFKILYPEKIPVSNSNSIFIGRTDSTLQHGIDTTFDTDKWEVDIELIIITKDNPKYERRKLLKSVVTSVKQIIKNSGLDIIVESVAFEYDNTNVLQQARLRLHGIEYDIYKESNEYLQICKILEDIEVK